MYRILWSKKVLLLFLETVKKNPIINLPWADIVNIEKLFWFRYATMGQSRLCQIKAMK